VSATNLGLTDAQLVISVHRLSAKSAKGELLDISLIEVPYHAGDDRHGSCQGPRRLIEAGAGELLQSQGHSVSRSVVDRGGPFRDTVSSSAAVNRRVAALVRSAAADGRLPVVLAASCVACQGVLAGFDHSESGAIWIDAHADFNTPESTATGFFPGMSLAVVTGHCYAHYWAQIGESTPLAEDKIAMFGVRDLSPERERERLERSAITVVGWRDGRPLRNPIQALDALAHRVDNVYLHVDFDGFAPEFAPGTADEPVPGGLSPQDAETILRAAGERFRIRAVTLATFTPDRDKDRKTLRLGLRLIELIGEVAPLSG
jgi:arginase